MEPDRTDVRRVVRHLPPVGQHMDLLATCLLRNMKNPAAFEQWGSSCFSAVRYITYSA